jgi:hypothetical protein
MCFTSDGHPVRAWGTPEELPGYTVTDRLARARCKINVRFVRLQRDQRLPLWYIGKRKQGVLRGCLKSPEMSVFDRCRATSEGPQALYVL